MRLATIDIGTNTVLMLVADLSPDGSLHPILELQEIPRLGKDVDRHKRLSRARMTRTAEILRAFAERARDEGAKRILACGTSALRDAANRDEFLRLASERAALDITILSGVEEARRTYLGAVADLLPPHSELPTTVIDIGGGSTEVVFGMGRVITSATSIDLGAVRVTERCFPTLPPSRESLGRARALIRTSLSTIHAPHTIERLYAVAGTPVTLACLIRDHSHFDPNAVHGLMFTREALGQITDQLTTMTVPEIARMRAVQPGRADVLPAGGLILVEAMDQLGVERLWVSSRGLRYGIAYLDGMETLP